MDFDDRKELILDQTATCWSADSLEGTRRPKIDLPATQASSGHIATAAETGIQSIAPTSGQHNGGEVLEIAYVDCLVVAVLWGRVLREIGLFRKWWMGLWHVLLELCHEGLRTRPLS